MAIRSQRWGRRTRSAMGRSARMGLSPRRWTELTALDTVVLEARAYRADESVRLCGAWGNFPDRLPSLCSAVNALAFDVRKRTLGTSVRQRTESLHESHFLLRPSE